MIDFKCAMFGLAALAVGTTVQAELKPHTLFSQGAVLQRGVPMPVYGTGKPGENVSVEFAGQTVKTVTGTNGEWRVMLKPLEASCDPLVMVVQGDTTLTITNLLVGEVWVASGQSNMDVPLGKVHNALETIASVEDPLMRFYVTGWSTPSEPQRWISREWKYCTPAQAPNFSAVAYFFARELRQKLRVPVGILQSSWGGSTAEAWMPREALAGHPVLKDYLAREVVQQADYEKALTNYAAAHSQYTQAVATAKAANLPVPEAPVKPGLPYELKVQKRPCLMYNGKIAPLLSFPMKGAIWYQGEANNGEPELYKTLFPEMVRVWRERWGQGDFPFLYVQIAPFKGLSPEFREAQRLCQKLIPNSAMVVITDYGVEDDIHPLIKEPVGKRLALTARALAYGEAIEYSGPHYKALQIEGTNAIVTFDHVGRGLVASTGALRGFTLAGADNQYFPAKAGIVGDTVVVNSDAVAAPVAVRYGWTNMPSINLYNRDGLPASPFQTSVETLRNPPPEKL